MEFEKGVARPVPKGRARTCMLPTLASVKYSCPSFAVFATTTSHPRLLLQASIDTVGEPKSVRGQRTRARSPCTAKYGERRTGPPLRTAAVDNWLA